MILVVPSVWLSELADIFSNWTMLSNQKLGQCIPSWCMMFSLGNACMSDKFGPEELQTLNPCKTLVRKTGQSKWLLNQVSMQVAWKTWPQFGSNLSHSPSRNSLKHTEHSVFPWFLPPLISPQNRTDGSEWMKAEAKPMLSEFVKEERPLISD